MGEDCVGWSGVLVGFGIIAEGHAAGYQRQEKMNIVAVVDPSRERRRVAQAMLPGVRTYGSLGAALESESPDFADICTPPVFHLPMMLECLRWGVNVLCEKPLVMDSREIMILKDALLASTGRLYPCHNYKFAPAVREVTMHLAAAGPVLGGTFTTVRKGHARGVSEWNEHWRRRRPLGGGGILRDHGPHSVYLAEYFVGRPVTAVSCELRHPSNGPWTSTEEEAKMALQFGDVVIDISLAWTGSRRQTRFALDTATGSVVLDGDVVEILNSGRREARYSPSDFDDPRHGSWFGLMLDDAAARLREPDGTRPLVDEAIRTIEVIECAYLSAAENGRPIRLSTSRVVP